MTTYKYAVIDGNQPPDMTAFPESCHHTIEAAKKAADRLNRGDANAHYYVADWGASRSAKLRPAPEHYPTADY